MIFFYAGIDCFPELARKLRIENILLSYFYLEDKEGWFKQWEDKGIKRIFLDSGGYTARIKGITIDVKDYGEFIKKYKKELFCYANLDVQNSKETQENQKYLERQGLKPLPIFHYDEFRMDKKLLLKYLECLAVSAQFY